MSRYAVILVILTICDKILTLPNDIEKCRINDDKCLLKSSNKVLWKHYGGIKELNLAPLDPFYVDYVKIVQDAGIVVINAVGNNTSIYGFSKGKFEKVTGFDVNKPEIVLKAPKLNFSGLYSSVANVLGLSINGKGSFKVSFNNFVGTYKMKLERYQKNGKEYFKVLNSKLTFDISGGEIDVPDQGYFTNVFLNASFDAIIKRSLISVISEEWTKFFEKAVKAVFNKVPIEELFLA
ncbi:circadian clock-controlled protein daywake-like [Chironomus tepperi]|uniref:circadian clock-controlled protein daywake-like n=1 Tax=Chironomus tepperi TaxID=113505 RepID=UPI00391F477E